MRQTGLVYDATALLGFGEAATEPLPEALPGEIVIRYGGWSLQELRDSAVGRKLLPERSWYDEYPWAAEKLPPGTYRLHMPVPGSNDKTFAEQEPMLAEGESIAPAVLVASALLAHRLQIGQDLLNGDWTRCREQTAGGERVELGWTSGGRLCFCSLWGGSRCGDVWASSVGKAS
jgi:hypothetical protein